MATQRMEGSRAAARVTDEEAGRLLEILRRAVVIVCPYLQESQREDLVQSAVMRVLDLQRRSDEPREYTFSYLRRVAYSVFIDQIRRRQRRGEVPLEAEDAPQQPSDSPGPERRTLSREMSSALRACVEALIRPRRRAIILHLQGHTVGEIADLLSWDFKRAENLVYRGMANLRECLTGKGVRP